MASYAPKPRHADQEWIGCLTYKSTATGNPSPSEIAGIASRARSRNRELGITGMLLFEDGCFLQTLEGPPAHIDLLWGAIKRDPRHRDIRIMTEHISSARLFSNWDMLFYDRQRGSRNATACHAVPPAIARYIAKLVELALTGDDAALDGFVASLAEQGWKGDAVVALLIEPAARALGDRWLADECSEIDLTIGLSMLQLAGHRVRCGAPAQARVTGRHSILLATAPGEPHRLGTALLADEFTDAGWHVDMAFPDSAEALANQVKAQRPDALDISLSDALPRRHALDRLSQTIACSRQADPAIISVGGRLFAEAAVTAMSVGADHARASIIGASVNITDLVKQKRAR